MNDFDLRKYLAEGRLVKVLSPGESFSDFEKNDINPYFEFPTFESIQRTMKSLHGVDVDIYTIEDYIGAANGGDGLERFGQDERIDFIQYLQDQK